MVLEAYFRAPQFYNGQLEYYYDGVAYYFVKLKNGDVDYRTIVSSFLVDDSIRKVEYKKGGMLSYIPSIPVPEFNAISAKSDGSGCRIDTLPSKLMYSFDHLFPDTAKSMKIGKYSLQLRNSYSSEVYTNISDGISYTDLVSGRWSRQMVINYKNVRKVYSQWEEVYITKVFFADKQELKDLKKNSLDIVDINRYIEQNAIPPISNNIKVKLPDMKRANRKRLK